MRRIIRALALSDLHLGEPETLLYNSEDDYNLIDTTIDKINELSEGDGTFDRGIEELILIGDIVELSEADEEEAYSNAKAFLVPLVEKIKPDKIVYIPGNHDHHLWVELLKTEQGVYKYKKCTPKVNTESSIKKKEIFTERCLPVDYPPEKVDIRYPNYLLAIDNAYYLFDHGHLFSTFLHFFHTKKAKTLTEAEEKSYKFMEWLWYRKNGNFLQRLLAYMREIFWDYLRRFVIYEIPYWLKRTVGGAFSESSRHVTFREDCTPLLDDGLREKILWYLEKICGISSQVEKDFHFIFGHTHNGGRLLKEDRKIRLNERFITLWNTGGWIVPSEVFSPDAYIFYIKRSKTGTKPNLYKLASQRENSNDEGNYPRVILEKRHKQIGKV